MWYRALISRKTRKMTPARLPRINFPPLVPPSVPRETKTDDRGRRRVTLIQGSRPCTSYTRVIHAYQQRAIFVRPCGEIRHSGKVRLVTDGGRKLTRNGRNAEISRHEHLRSPSPPPASHPPPSGVSSLVGTCKSLRAVRLRIINRSANAYSSQPIAR